MQEDVNHYELRGRVSKLSRLKRGGVFGKSSFQVRVETLSPGDRTPVVHVVLLLGELAEKAYYEICLKDTIHVVGKLKFQTWKENGTEKSAPYLETDGYQHVEMNEQGQVLQKTLERPRARR